MHQMLMQILCLQWKTFAHGFDLARDSRAKSYTRGFDYSAPDSMKSEGTSSGFVSASDSLASKSASFPLQPKDLHHHLMHWNPSVQVFPLVRETVFWPDGTTYFIS